MVILNPLKRIIRNAAFKLCFVLIIFLNIICLFGCNSFKSNKVVNIIHEKKPTFVSLKNKKTYNIPTNIFIDARLNEEELLVRKEESKKLYIYNLKNMSTRDFLKAYNPNNFIHTVVCNSKWVVWIEDESLIMNTENKPFKWQMIAYNIKTGEKLILDKSKFTTNKFNVPMFINYTPDQLTISNNDVVVYCKTSFENQKLISEIDSFDLKSKKQSNIAKTGAVIDELIADCSIYGDSIVWSKYRVYNETLEKRLTQYIYSDLFIYNLKTNKTKQLTKDGFYTNPSLYKNNLVAIDVIDRNPAQNSCWSNVIIMDIKTTKIKTIVNEKTPIIKSGLLEVYRSIPKINSRYISWSNNGLDDRFVYDYTNNSFLEVYNNNDNNPANSSNIYNMFDNLVLIYDQKEGTSSTNLCVDITE
ncbi:hypothetical protein [Clostridium bowmanii]|uniref:hypothetical protein n=1 Tax=Clostridium bowmanii TaxID=132925 RepID=UPI001C0BBFC6|nr:hypothetical protein [Clostridium bowmanii]MBU3192205.1 hypothetical protein [Clostridium bowmanii]